MIFLDTEILVDNALENLSDLSDKERLKALRDMKRDLIDKVRAVERQRSELKSARDDLNKQVKELFQQAKETREARDAVNEDVKLNKALRDLRQEDVTKIVGELEKLEGEMQEIGINTSGRSSNRHSRLAKRVQELEIQFQTQGNLTIEKEKELMGEIEKISKEMEKVEVVEGKRDEFRAINKKLRKLRTEALSHHREVQKSAEKSQEYHETMMKQLKEAKGVRTNADAKHKEVLALNDEIKKIRKEINKVANESDKLRKALGEETAVERKKRKAAQARQQEQDLTDKAQDIYDRYKSGEKLGFEEFKILISRGLLKE